MRIKELRQSGRFILPATLCLCLTVSVACGQGVPTPDKAAPPWGEFLPQGTPDLLGGDLGVDPLLRKPFRMSPEDSAAGLAAKIRARELDIPNRIAAIEYLSTLHCQQFPEARAMLVAVMLNDEWEPVRFAAATALRDMFKNSGCPKPAEKSDCQVQQHLRESHAGVKKQIDCVHKEVKGAIAPILACDPCALVEATKAKAMALLKCDCKGFFTPQAALERKRGKPDAPKSGDGTGCIGCCDAETLNKLSLVAYKLNDDGSCLEPSRRVREMAVQAIEVCGVPCHLGMQTPEIAPPVGKQQPVEPPPVVPEEDSVEPPPSAKFEGLDFPFSADAGKPEQADVAASQAASTDKAQVPVVSASKAEEVQPAPATLIPGLENVCVVSFHAGNLVKPSPEFCSSYRGRLYHFANAAAKQTFDENPADYAVAFGGCDPVHFVATRQATTGRFLMKHEGRLLMFVSTENVKDFKAHSERYSVNPVARQSVHTVGLETAVSEKTAETNADGQQDETL